MVEENEMNMSKPTSPFEPDKSHMEKHVCLGSSFVILTLSYPRLVHFGCLISEVAWGILCHLCETWNNRKEYGVASRNM
ncbi:unnamed protein product [Brassica oleracea var. botrytis]